MENKILLENIKSKLPQIEKVDEFLLRGGFMCFSTIENPEEGNNVNCPIIGKCTINDNCPIVVGVCETLPPTETPTPQNSGNNFEKNTMLF